MTSTSYRNGHISHVSLGSNHWRLLRGFALMTSLCYPWNLFDTPSMLYHSCPRRFAPNRSRLIAVRGETPMFCLDTSYSRKLDQYRKYHRYYGLKAHIMPTTADRSVPWNWPRRNSIHSICSISHIPRVLPATTILEDQVAIPGLGTRCCCLGSYCTFPVVVVCVNKGWCLVED